MNTTRRQWLKRAGIFVPAAFGILPAAAQMAFPRARGFRYPAAASYAAVASRLDGSSNDYMYRTSALSNSTASKLLIFSCWIRLLANGAALYLAGFRDAAETYRGGIFSLSDDTFGFQFYSGSSAVVSVTASGVDWTGDTNWHHVLLSFDTNNSSNRALYHDGVAASPTWAIYTADATIDWNWPNVRILGNNGGTQTWNGDICEFYLCKNHSSYFDITVQENREKFRSPGGKPVSLGSNGSTPTGTVPLIYWKGAYNSGVNASGNGDFTQQSTFTDITPP